MSHALSSAVLCSLLLGAAVATAETRPAPSATAPAAHAADRHDADREGWPDTRVGELARGWVSAFSVGPDSMKAFITHHLAASSLASKGVAQRVERYLDLREKYGTLTLVSVVKAEGPKLTAKLMASDATSHEFVFTAQDEAPYHLVSVGIMEPGHFGHMFGH